MRGRLASLLVLAAALASCREPMSDRDRGPLDEFAVRGERAFSAVSGRRGDAYFDESVSPYERGVRDGLRDAGFDQEERSAAYARGYEAGRRELLRDRQRLQANERRAEDRPAPRRARERREVDYADNEPGAREEGSGDDRAGDHRRVASFAGGGGRQAPIGGMRACADEVEQMFGLSQGSAAAVSARPRENGGFDVTVRADGRRALCRLNADGDVKGVDEQ